MLGSQLAIQSCGPVLELLGTLIVTFDDGVLDVEIGHRVDVTGPYALRIVPLVQVSPEEGEGIVAVHLLVLRRAPMGSFLQVRVGGSIQRGWLRSLAICQVSENYFSCS